jgi:two-component system response regulator PhoP
MIPVATAEVLIVEDDDVIRAMLVAALQREGLRVTAARDGVDGLDILRMMPFAVVIVDLMMPRMSGFELLDAIAAEIRKPLPMIFVMTAYDDSVIRRLDSAIVAGVLRKPFDLEHLVALVRDCARNYSQACAATGELPLEGAGPMIETVC